MAVIIVCKDLQRNETCHAVQAAVVQQQGRGQNTTKNVFKTVVQTNHQRGVHTTVHQVISNIHVKTHLFRCQKQMTKDLRSCLSKPQ